MRTTTKLAALLVSSAAILFAAAPAFASDFCDPETSECPTGPSGPPPLPSIPQTSGQGGNFMVGVGTIQQQNYVQGQIQGNTYFTFGGGPSQPLPSSGVLTMGQTNNSITLSSTLTPLASVSAVAVNTVPQDPNFPGFDLVARGGITMSYLIDLHANSQAAADTLNSLLTTSGAIAGISGSWSLDATGTSWGSVSASTGTNELDSSLASGFSSSCSLINYFGTPQGCGNGSYSAALNFVSGSVYDGGSAFDFYSMITLSASANAGPPDLGYGMGTLSAYIDPDIFFNPNLDLSQYSLTVAGQDMRLVAGSGAGGVPEPAEWALMLVGFGGLGALLRHRRAVALAA